MATIPASTVRTVEPSSEIQELFGNFGASIRLRATSDPYIQDALVNNNLRVALDRLLELAKVHEYPDAERRLYPVEKISRSIDASDVLKRWRKNHTI